MPKAPAEFLLLLGEERQIDFVGSGPNVDFLLQKGFGARDEVDGVGTAVFHDNDFAVEPVAIVFGTIELGLGVEDEHVVVGNSESEEKT